MTDPGQFRCAVCGGMFAKAWSDAEAESEKDAIWGDVPLEDCDLICDDCFQAIMPRAAPKGVASPEDAGETL